MTDAIDELIEKYRFNEFIEDKECCKNTILHLYNAWESFIHNYPKPLQIDVIRRCIKQFIIIQPNYIWLQSENSSEITDRVVERVIDRICEVGHEEGEKERRFTYIT